MSLVSFLTALFFTLYGLIAVFGLTFPNQTLFMGILALLIGLLMFWSMLPKKVI